MTFEHPQLAFECAPCSPSSKRVRSRYIRWDVWASWCSHCYDSVTSRKQKPRHIPPILCRIHNKTHTHTTSILESIQKLLRTKKCKEVLQVRSFGSVVGRYRYKCDVHSLLRLPLPLTRGDGRFFFLPFRPTYVFDSIVFGQNRVACVYIGVHIHLVYHKPQTSHPPPR